MKLSSLLRSTAVVIALFSSSSLWAAECSDVVWSTDTLAKYPNIADVCQTVVEKDGRQYVEAVAKFVSIRSGKAHIKFQHRDGSYGDTFETRTLPEGMTVMLDGKSTSVHRIPRDSILTIFVPVDRFGMVYDMNYASDVVDLDEPAPAAMPHTASALPLLGALGAFACLMGLVLTGVRRFRRQ